MVFFTIPLDPCDAPRFAFSIPSVDASEPNKQYHWTVLPEGMKNSPAICQWFVARALSPAREKLPNALIYHYMDDILVATRTESEMQIAMSVVLDNIKLHHLEVAPEKVQKTPPWNYLGWRITNQHIIPTDSAYVAGVVSRLEASYLKEIDHKPLFVLFQTLLASLNHRENQYFIMHVRSHTSLPAPLTEGNSMAD